MTTHIETLRSDWRRNKGNPKGKILVLSFRVANIISRQKDTNTIIWMLGLPILILYRVLIEWIIGMEIPAKTTIGPGLIVYHGQGLIVHSKSTLGSNVTLRHNTTIGNKQLKNGEPSPSPILGNNVDLGANVVIIGPITVGDNSIVGAGAVVTKDTPKNSIAAGNPAKVIGIIPG